MVLEEPNLSDSARMRLQKVEGLAKHISEKLAMTHEEHAAAAGT
jgi:hypothetical protein